MTIHSFVISTTIHSYISQSDLHVVDLSHNLFYIGDLHDIVSSDFSAAVTKILDLLLVR